MSNQHNKQAADYGLVTEVRPRRHGGQCFLATVLIINTLILTALFVCGVTVYANVNGKADKIMTIVDTLASGNPDPNIVASMAAMIRSSLSDVFFLGSKDGTVANFMTNALSTDVASVAKDIAQFTQVALPTLEAHLFPHECAKVPVVCKYEGEPLCDYQFWCGEAGQTFMCRRISCVNPFIAFPLSVAQSVALKTLNWQPVGGNASGPAAFSNGVFQLDSVMGWFKAQLNYGEWQTVGKYCVKFSAQVSSIDWTIQYVDDNGNIKEYDANKRVHDARMYIEQVCNAMNGLGQRQQQRKLESH